MRTIVCVKQVPASNEVRLDEKTNTIIRDGGEAVINPFDSHALEAALALKEQFGGTVAVLSMGIPAAADMLRQCVARGADEALLLTDRAFAGADTLATSYALSLGIARMGGADLIVCGKMAVDGDTAQIGPELAQHLGIPHVSDVSEILEAADDHLIVRRVWDEIEQELHVPLPALITVIKGQNPPELATIPGMLRGRAAEIPMWSAEALSADTDRCGLRGSPTQVVKTFTPPARGQAQVIAGTTAEQARALAQICREVLHGTD